ncbi:Zinc finger MYM-type protein 1, partial [Camponotus floridanus]
WLIYSKSKNAVFCFSCSLYKRNENKFSSSSGYSDWSNIYRAIKDHEQTKKHLEAFKSWQLFANRMVSQHTIDFHNEKVLKIEEMHWRDVFKRIILIVKYLAQQNLAFRGTSNTLYTSNNGNFLQLVQMIAEFDSTMAEHLRRYLKKENGHYLSNIIQNELLSSMSKLIFDSIISSINSNKYFAIIVDSTPDISHQDQLTIVVRFV